MSRGAVYNGAQFTRSAYPQLESLKHGSLVSGVSGILTHRVAQCGARSHFESFQRRCKIYQQLGDPSLDS